MADQQPTLASASPSETNSLAASTSTPAGPVWNCYLTHHKLSDRAASAKWAKRLTNNTSFQVETRYDPESTEHWIFRRGEMALWTNINQTMKDLVAEKVDERKGHQHQHSHHSWSPVSSGMFVTPVDIFRSLMCPVIGNSESRIQRTRKSIRLQTVVSHISTKAGATADD